MKSSTLKFQICFFHYKRNFFELNGVCLHLAREKYFLKHSNVVAIYLESTNKEIFVEIWSWWKYRWRVLAKKKWGRLKPKFVWCLNSLKFFSLNCWKEAVTRGTWKEKKNCQTLFLRSVRKKVHLYLLGGELRYRVYRCGLSCTHFRSKNLLKDGNWTWSDSNILVKKILFFV